MGRYGALTVQFYDRTLTPLGEKQAVEASSHERVNGEGEARITFVNDSDLSTYAAVGNIAWAWKTDAVRTDTADGVVVCEPFTITRRATVPGNEFLEISGSDLLNELKRFTVYAPIGAPSVNSTTVKGNIQGTTSTTTTAAASAGASMVQVASSNSDNETQEIRIALTGGGTHVTVIEKRELIDGVHKLKLRDKLPAAVSNGAAVTLRRRIVPINNTEGFVDGTEVEITFADTTKQKTIMLDDPDGGNITLRDGLIKDVDDGSPITATSYTGKLTTDVKDVLAKVPGWTGVFDSPSYYGTAAGTVYGGGGETVYNILRNIADETGEFFRLRSAETATRGPKREVRWMRSWSAAGASGTLRLVEPTDATMDDDTYNKNRAIMLRRPEFSGEYEPVTQLIPVAGDSSITLFSCSPGAVAAALSAGFTVVTTGLGLYAPPYIDWTSQTAAIGTYQRRVTFSEVTASGTSTDAIQAAADKLLQLSIKYMKARRATSRTLNVECVSPVAIRPGDTVELYYQPPAGPTPVYTLNFTAGQSEPKLYVQEVERTVSSSGDYPGVPVTRLVLSPAPEAPEGSGGREAARRLNTVERLAAQANTPRSVNISVPAPGGSSPPLTLTSTTGNATTVAGHTHAITSFSENINNPGHITKTDMAGTMQLSMLRTRYVQFSNAGGEIPGAAERVRVYRRIENGVAFLVGAFVPTGASGVAEE